ncbi:MAG TPA: family 43 glycosylhydrolase [Candidatus Coprousia avicola]|nr:family 43 glycosylhydrolase [Candidatus Coprousia avicola]
MQDLVFNPYLPFWEYVPDGEPHVFGDRLYVYGSHDRRDGASYCQEDYVVWSAPVNDLSQWRCEGVSYHRTDDPRHAATGGADLMAPDVAQGPDGRYYLYYCDDMTAIGVAVSDVPEGPFAYLDIVRTAGGEPLADGSPFDPGVLVDEGRVWLYWGFDPSKFLGEEAVDRSGAFVVELEADMHTCKGSPVKIAPGYVESKGTSFEGHAFFEASSPRRIGDRYYFVYSSELGHELCYATAPAPTGPFAFGGTIVSIADVGYRGNTVEQAYPANTHGGLVCVGGQWYVFYHRHTHKRQYSRQGCAERIEIERDGSIPQVEMTSCGLNGGPLPTGAVYPAHIACGIRGPEGVVHISTHRHRRPSDPYLVQEGDRETGSMVAANLQDGAELTFKYFAFTGAERACAITARGSFEGTVEVLSITPAGEVARIGEVAVGPAEQWQSQAGSIEIPAAMLGVRLVPRGTGALDVRDIYLGVDQL